MHDTISQLHPSIYLTSQLGHFIHLNEPRTRKSSNPGDAGPFALCSAATAIDGYHRLSNDNDLISSPSSPLAKLLLSTYSSFLPSASFRTQLINTHTPLHLNAEPSSLLLTSEQIYCTPITPATQSVTSDSQRRFFVKRIGSYHRSAKPPDLAVGTKIPIQERTLPFPFLQPPSLPRFYHK